MIRVETSKKNGICKYTFSLYSTYESNTNHEFVFVSYSKNASFQTLRAELHKNRICKYICIFHKKI